MAPPPPPPPPPICFPFSSKKPKRRLSWTSADSRAPLPAHAEQKVVKHPSFSPTSTLTSQADSLEFHSDSEKYDELPTVLPTFSKDEKGRPKLQRSNTMTGTKKSTGSNKWGYGWGVGKKDKAKEAEAEMNEKSSSQLDLPLYQPVVRRDSKSTQASRSTQRTQDSNRTQDTYRTQVSQHSKETYRSNESRSTAPKPRPPLLGGGSSQLFRHDSTSTLVGSAFERKINDTESIREKPDTTSRLDDMRRLMLKDNLDF